MSNSIILEHYDVLTGLGDLAQTVKAILEGKSAVRPGPCFGVSAAFAPFRDESWRDVLTSVDSLASRLGIRDKTPGDTAFFFAAAKGDLRAVELLQSGDSLSAAPSPLLGRQAETIMLRLGVRAVGPIVLSNACASGLIAIEVASEMLAAGECSRAIVFGFDVLSRFVATGFNSLGALSPTGARPFDKDRNGLSLGEGAAMAVLSCREPRKGELVIAGSGSSNDANHRTGPSRTGDGLHYAAQAALDNAGLSPADIGAVKCHGTATPYNDAMEAKALVRLFGSSIPPCFSMKGALGHTSGGGSLVEMIIAGELLKRRLAPPTAGFSTIGVEEPLPISDRTQPITTSHILCLSAGFGGVNAAAVLREAA